MQALSLDITQVPHLSPTHECTLVPKEVFKISSQVPFDLMVAIGPTPKWCSSSPHLLTSLLPAFSRADVPQVCQLKFSPPTAVQKPLITKWCLDSTPPVTNSIIVLHLKRNKSKSSCNTVCFSYNVYS